MGVSVPSVIAVLMLWISRLRDRRRVRAAEEAGDLRRVLDQVEGLLVEVHLDEHVAGEELARRRALLALDQLHHGLRRDEDVAELLGQARLADAIEQRELRLVLVARVGVDDVPLHRHWSSSQSPASVSGESSLRVATRRSRTPSG